MRSPKNDFFCHFKSPKTELLGFLGILKKNNSGFSILGISLLAENFFYDLLFLKIKKSCKMPIEIYRHRISKKKMYLLENLISYLLRVSALKFKNIFVSFDKTRSIFGFFLITHFFLVIIIEIFFLDRIWKIVSGSFCYFLCSIFCS